ncbi:ABC transporter substrate-binding protein [Tissierella sp. Yu-01]|uniref:ABC transporter substrate-binding protein n=1 Tax=Tissierella sp. Yu-01 TaxID=3035694 RepID=UPI00240E09F5|nr:ABC transporter substrate-binding protein [Tissierella sp. Yu-01]WFA07983.1 ABC transporter substrate-binding protein [Tissierella sp. Yu-01]
MKKIFGLIILLVAGLFTGCVKDKDTVTIGIAQFGEHASLDNCREGFIEGLKEEGFIEGENLTIINENAQFDTGISNQIAQNFVSKKVDLIAAIATPMAQSSFNAAKDKDIPVVFTAVTDPEAAMLTEGNVTGTSDKLPVEAQLKLIRAMMPESKKIGILYTTSEVNSISTIEEYKSLSEKYGFEIVDMGISVAADIPLAMDRILPQIDAMTNLTDNTVVGSLPAVLSKANEKNIPVFGSEIEQVKLGCVASEGIEYIELGRQTGRMAAQVLRGEKTADEIPFEIIEESSLYINSDVMDKLGLTLPQEYMDRAMDVVGK